MGKSFICDVCGKVATIHLTQITNDQVQKMDLCECCAQVKGTVGELGFSLSDLVANYIQNYSQEVNPIIPIANAKDSPKCECGWSTVLLKKQGYLGCAHCYGIHEDWVRSVLHATQKDFIHRGKVPKRGYRNFSNEQKITKLANQLKQAIIEERFEEAAKLRDLIHSTKKSEPESLA